MLTLVQQQALRVEQKPPEPRRIDTDVGQDACADARPLAGDSNQQVLRPHGRLARTTGFVGCGVKDSTKDRRGRRQTRAPAPRWAGELNHAPQNVGASHVKGVKRASFSATGGE